ncbi:MAG: 50S ribosomal protein L32 [Lentisphaerae bacterium]|jgi:large subunit ribosomal protein L32|nr:50S ribosomal protein L32 [Lentisphaerota bacterium]
MAVPKRRKSKSRKQMRIKSHKKAMPALSKCRQCGAPSQPHRVCPACGYYAKRQVLSITAD